MLFSLIVYAAEESAWADCMIDGVPTLKCLEVVFSQLLKISSQIALLILLVMFVIGSILYLTSGGEKEKVDRAKKTLTYAIAGLVLFLSSYLILLTIDTLFLGGEGLLFKWEIPEFAPE